MIRDFTLSIFAGIGGAFVLFYAQDIFKREYVELALSAFGL